MDPPAEYVSVPRMWEVRFRRARYRLLLVPEGR